MFSPGELSFQRTLPVLRSIARNDGALGEGILRCPSSTPFDVFTKRMSPMQQTEQLHMLCCETAISFIMSTSQMTSASSLFSLGSFVNGPLFLPSWKPLTSRQTMVPRLVT